MMRNRSRVRPSSGAIRVATSNDFGPSFGAQLVRDNAGPRAVSDPGGGRIQITTADNANFNTILSSNPSATFWIRAGTYNRTSAITPTSGQTLVFEDGAIIDGGGTDTAGIYVNGATNVTIRGGLVRNWGSTTNLGISGRGILVGTDTSSNCTIEDVTATGNYYLGIACQSSATVSYCAMNDNGKLGYAGGKNIEYYRCEVSGNNTRLTDPGGEAGAGKTAGVDAISVNWAESWVHDNLGFGVWYDTAASNPTGGDFTVQECVIEGNQRSGLFFEGTAGGCTAYRNYISDNGFDGSIGGQSPSNVNNVQVRIACADEREGVGIRGNVYRNILDYTRTPTATDPGWLLMLWNHNGHPERLFNWDIHDNQFWLRTTQTGDVGGLDTATDLGGGETQVWDGDNDYYDNKYYVASMSTSFWRWDSGAGTGVAKTWAEWQAFGQDTSGTRVLI